MDLSALGGSWQEMVGSAVRGQVQGLAFRSTISPEVQLDVSQGEPRSLDQGGFSEVFLRAVKPAFYLDTSMGTVTVAPWGEPRESYFPLLAGALVLGGVAVAYLIVRGLLK